MTTIEAVRILELKTSFSASDLRAAYHRKAKETHPDLATPSDASHFRMIEVIQAYNQLRNRIKENPAVVTGCDTRTSDYDFYKQGIVVFEKIHPSEWIRVTKAGLFDPSLIVAKASNAEAYRTALERIREAYQLFTDLIDRYPDSIWAADCRDKLKRLDRMIVRYKNMAKNSG